MKGTENKRFQWQRLAFINPKNGATILDLTPNIGNPLYLSPYHFYLYSSATIPPTDLPYADYRVKITFDVEGPKGRNRHNIELNLAHQHRTYLGIPRWEAFRWL